MIYKSYTFLRKITILRTCSNNKHSIKYLLDCTLLEDEKALSEINKFLLYFELIILLFTYHNQFVLPLIRDVTNEI